MTRRLTAVFLGLVVSWDDAVYSTDLNKIDDFRLMVGAFDFRLMVGAFAS